MRTLCAHGHSEATFSHYIRGGPFCRQLLRLKKKYIHRLRSPILIQCISYEKRFSRKYRLLRFIRIPPKTRKNILLSGWHSLEFKSIYGSMNYKSNFPTCLSMFLPHHSDWAKKNMKNKFFSNFSEKFNALRADKIETINVYSIKIIISIKQMITCIFL